MTTIAAAPSRRAWVTGAGSGIGRALVQRLAADGWLVAASARTEADLASLAAGAPGRIVAFPLDVTDKAAVTTAAVAIEAQLGPLDLVVLNAGTYRPVTATSFSTDAWREMVEVNLLGTVNCLAAIMPAMIARRSGHIAVVSSLTGHVGLPSASAYGATKAALINMCEALHPELEAEGVQALRHQPRLRRYAADPQERLPHALPDLVGRGGGADHARAEIGQVRDRFPDADEPCHPAAGATAPPAPPRGDAPDGAPLRPAPPA